MVSEWPGQRGARAVKREKVGQSCSYSCLISWICSWQPSSSGWSWARCLASCSLTVCWGDTSDTIYAKGFIGGGRRANSEMMAAWWHRWQKGGGVDVTGRGRRVHLHTTSEHQMVEMWTECGKLWSVLFQHRSQTVADGLSRHGLETETPKTRSLVVLSRFTTCRQHFGTWAANVMRIPESSTWQWWNQY